MNFKERLLAEWENEKKRLESIDPEKQKDLYKEQLSRITEVERRLVDLTNTELELDDKNESRKVEKSGQFWRNAVEVGKALLTVGAAVGMGLYSMRFEKEDIVTTTAGKSSLRDILKFKI